MKQTTVKQFDYKQKCPTIVTAFSRIRKGLEPVAPKKDLGYAAKLLVHA